MKNKISQILSLISVNKNLGDKRKQKGEIMDFINYLAKKEKSFEEFLDKLLLEIGEGSLLTYTGLINLLTKNYPDSSYVWSIHSQIEKFKAEVVTQPSKKEEELEIIKEVEKFKANVAERRKQQEVIIQ